MSLLLRPRVKAVFKTDVLCGRIVDIVAAAAGIVALHDRMPAHMQPIHGVTGTIVVTRTLLTDGVQEGSTHGFHSGSCWQMKVGLERSCLDLEIPEDR